jgi:hypothetical protein
MTESLLKRGWSWISNQIVQEVPKDSALCNSDCRKDQCTTGEWTNCERRLNNAHGELMPTKRDVAKE